MLLTKLECKIFLDHKIQFLDIAHVVFKALDHFGVPKISSIDEVFEYDYKTREYLRGMK